MAISPDATSNASGGSTNPLTMSHTCSGANRALVVGVGTNGQNAVGANYGGTPMTLIGTTQENSTGHRVFLYGLIAPATGTNTITVSLSAAAAYSMRGMSFNGVHQSVMNGSYQGKTASTSVSMALSMSSTAGDMVVDFLVWNQNALGSSASVGAQQTLYGGAGAGAFVRIVGSYESGSAVTTMSWAMTSATNMTQAGVSLRPAPAASVSTSATTITWAAQTQVANQTGTTAITLAKPTSTSANDLLMAALSWKGIVTIMNAAPAGWTQINLTQQGTSASDSTTGVTMATYYHMASAGEGVSYTWSLSGAAVQNAGMMWRITGTDLSTPYDAGTENMGTGSQANATQATTQFNDELVCFLSVFNSSQAGFSFTIPTGYTLHTDIETAGDIHFLGVEKAQAGSGSTGAAFALGNNAIAADNWIVQVVTFHPQVGGGDAFQYGMECYPTRKNDYWEYRWPRSYVGWQGKDVSPDVQLAAGPFWHLDVPIHHAYSRANYRNVGFASEPIGPDAVTSSPPGSFVVSDEISPRISVPPPTLVDTEQWQRQAQAWMTEANQGHLQNTGIITLTANQNSTVVIDERAGPNSFIEFMPRTASAALEKGNGTMYVSLQGKKTFTITHSNAADTDRTFIYTILG